jgi:hypothetical protein
MKKSELKNIIKECVKEVIFEEGVLSSIITEVAQGLQSGNRTQPTPMVSEGRQSQLKNTKREVMAAVGRDSYAEAKKKFSNPELFEGTRPLPNDSSPSNPLSGMNPNDPGVDISSIPGFGNWGTVANFDK